MHSIQHLRRILFAAALLLSALHPLRLMAGGYPLLFNYSYEQYGADADLQNWDITQSEAGEIFVANNNCVLRFDGYYWTKVSSYGDRIFRSTCAVGNRVYVGRHYDIGYLQRNAYGDYDYVSLTDGTGNEEIWNIHRAGNTTYFQSFSGLYASEGDSLRKVELGFVPFLTFTDGYSLFIHAFGGKTYSMNERDTTLLFTNDEIGGANVVGFMPLDRPDEYMIVSSTAGLYTYKNGAVRPFRTEADGLLKQFAVNKACRTRRGNIVIGTYRSGVICVSPEGKLLWHYNSDTGLRNDCVLRLLCDKNDNIWACLDDGVALIATGSPYRLIGSKIGQQSIGMVYGINRREDQLFIATNQGVYSCDPSTLVPSPTLMHGTEGQNWHLTDVDGELYCGHNADLLKLEKGRFTVVPGTSSSSTCLRTFSHKNVSYLIESSYSELRLHRKRADGWARAEVIQGFSRPIRQIEIDADGTLWASDMSIGAYRITLSDDLTRVTDVTYYSEIDGVSSRCFVMKFGGQIVVSNGTRLYRYNDGDSAFEPFDRLNEILPSAEGIISITESSRGRYWVGSRTGYSLVYHSGDEWKLLRAVRTSSLGFRSNNVAASVYEHEGLTYFNLSDAVVTYDRNLASDTLHSAFFLMQARYINRRGEFVYLDTERLHSGQAKVSGNVFFRFSYPYYSSDYVRFEYEVHEFRKTQVLRSDVPEVLLTGLSNGRKRLYARAISSDGTILAEQEFSFRVLPPWYRRWWAYLIYMLITLLLAQLLVKYQVHKKTERQRLQLLEQDRIISEQKQQLLQTELELKSKDLASLSLDAAIKDNVIDSIQQAIRLQQKQGNIAQGAFNAELLRIRQTTGNEKNWAVFQQNFDLIHEHFFRNLKEQFPSLTTSDLRLCALLRLNMATKDIATYTGLSVRGVESARFRLRKKLNLEAEQNLSEFLLSFKSTSAG